MFITINDVDNPMILNLVKNNGTVYHTKVKSLNFASNRDIKYNSNYGKCENFSGR